MMATGKDTFFKQAANYSIPSSLKNGMLYTVTGDMGAPFDPGVIDLNYQTYPYRKVFKNREFIRDSTVDSYAFSPDGTKIALLQMARETDKKHVLNICSTADGTLLERYEFETAFFNRPQYLDYFEDGHLAMYSERYAYSTMYMYSVDIEAA